ncbi:OFA family MFS transporter [Sinanaerobacter chloroacetimidivorans]|jgi:OFA family oxalate/formate antiporter-like MFS transporter|uniref:OFA family MFS transporter n=1 Tax=Sinanaerobacter chloroacetimidivorans TaxID=2818044 RepID=A0A8J7W260_9FIRM|nr:OFA family MFS transporter [Sinanaerobacter chloroacetimidivorans]MBR0597768.1 OFA family MFS transporter [Sinanaerobacter chloroacetimidivorans]
MSFEQKRWQHMIAAMVLALCAGIGYTWSVFQKPLMEHFEWGIQTISLTFTIQVLVSTMAPVFLGKYQKTLGVKKYLRIGIAIYVIGLTATMFTSSIGYLYLIYGVVVGTGISMLYPCLMAYSGRLFPDKTGMAAGLLACAYGGGSIIWAPLAANFIGKQGVLPVFGLFAAIFVIVMIPFSFLIKDVPEDFRPEPKKKVKEGKTITASKDYTWREMLKTSRYYVIVIALTLGATAGLMIMGHASTILQEVQNFTPERAAFLIGIISIFNAFGRLTFGFVSDRLGRYTVMMLLFAMIVASMILLTISGGIVFVVALFAISACYGGFTSMFSPICADNFGIKNLAVNYSFLYVAYGFAGVIGPQLAARTKALGNGYNIAFMTVAVLSLVGFGLTLYLKISSDRGKEIRTVR